MGVEVALVEQPGIGLVQRQRQGDHLARADGTGRGEALLGADQVERADLVGTAPDVPGVVLVPVGQPGQVGEGGSPPRDGGGTHHRTSIIWRSLSFDTLPVSVCGTAAASMTT